MGRFKQLRELAIYWDFLIKWDFEYEWAKFTDTVLGNVTYFGVIIQIIILINSP